MERRTIFLTVPLCILCVLLLERVQALSLLAPCVNCRELPFTLGNHQAGYDQEGDEEESKPVPCPADCRCPIAYPQCQDGVPVVMDGCGCCPVCARQQGDVCNTVQVCDAVRKLQCTYPGPFSSSGICRVRSGQGCQVGDSQYRDGETFKLDCRTQCTCQNGTYGCVSLCPSENVKPSARCRHPQLMVVHGSCCREWLCDSTLLEDRKNHCHRYTSPWTTCSKTCDVGFSTRISNDNPECQLRNETRLCNLRPCTMADDIPRTAPRGHHVRKNHMCRATVRDTHRVRLTDGANCTSVRLYQPKYCGVCAEGHGCCRPKVTTAKMIQFSCNEEGESSELLLQKEVLWIIKCNCSEEC